MKPNTKLEKFMNEKGFWSFDFYSLCPTKNDIAVKFGNFEILMKNQNGTMELYTRYVGTSDKFKWVNEKENSQTRAYRYSSYGSGEQILINNVPFCKIARNYYGITKNFTVTPAYFAKTLEGLKRSRDGLSYSVKLDYNKEAEIKLLKKEVRKHKKIWEQVKKEAVQEVFEISYEEYLKEQVDVEDATATQFILKVAPMLTRLKDECTLILDKLNDSEGPSKQAKEDFFVAYSKFQGFYNNRTYLTNLKNFKIKKGRSKKK